MSVFVSGCAGVCVFYTCVFCDLVAVHLGGCVGVYLCVCALVFVVAVLCLSVCGVCGVCVCLLLFACLFLLSGLLACLLSGLLACLLCLFVCLCSCACAWSPQVLISPDRFRSFQDNYWNQFRKAEVQELNNGRLAMMAIVGLITQEQLWA